MKLFVTDKGEDKECANCGNEASEFYGVGVFKEKALEEFQGVEEGKARGVCSRCITDLLLDDNYHLIEDKGNILINLEVEERIKKELGASKHKLSDFNIRELSAQITHMAKGYINHSIDFKALARSMNELETSLDILKLDKKGTIDLYDKNNLDNMLKFSLNIQDEIRDFGKNDYLDIILDIKRKKVESLLVWNTQKEEHKDIDLTTKEMRKLMEWIKNNIEEIVGLADDYTSLEKEEVKAVIKEEYYTFY